MIIIIILAAIHPSRVYCPINKVLLPLLTTNKQSAQIPYKFYVFQTKFKKIIKEVFNSISSQESTAKVLTYCPETHCAYKVCFLIYYGPGILRKYK